MTESNHRLFHSADRIDGRNKETFFVNILASSSELFKLIFDRIFSLLALLFFMPFMVVVAILIYAEDRGPIFYVQTRIGKNGRRFGCIKFRSMVVDADDRLRRLLAADSSVRAEWTHSQKLKSDPRISRIGNFLRKTSLDELPQFLNVLFGDMSVVGPRPIVSDEIPRYKDKFVFYTGVKPGVTGLWQVCGRSDTSYEERVNLDVQYVQTRSMAMDLGIIFKTIGVVLLGRGAY